MRVRSKTHWTGESTAAAKGRSIDRTVVDDVHIDDGRGAEAGPARDGRLGKGAGRHEAGGHLVRDGQDDCVRVDLRGQGRVC